MEFWNFQEMIDIQITFDCKGLLGDYMVAKLLLKSHIFKAHHSNNTQGFLTVLTLQIDATIDWSNLGFISFWSIISNNTVFIVIKSWTDILGITFEVP